jgi:excisionase family DNA binding protein
MATGHTDKPDLDLTTDGFVDVSEAAEFLGVSRSALYQLMGNGALRYAKFGRSRRIPRRALRDYAANCIVGIEL